MSDTRALFMLMGAVVIVMIVGGTIAEYIRAQAEAQMVKSCLDAGGEWEPEGRLQGVICKRIK